MGDEGSRVWVVMDASEVRIVRRVGLRSTELDLAMTIRPEATQGRRDDGVHRSTSSRCDELQQGSKVANRTGSPVWRSHKVQDVSHSETTEAIGAPEAAQRCAKTGQHVRRSVMNG